MVIFWILDPDPHNNRCESATLPSTTLRVKIDGWQRISGNATIFGLISNCCIFATVVMSDQLCYARRWFKQASKNYQSFRSWSHRTYSKTMTNKIIMRTKQYLNKVTKKYGVLFHITVRSAVYMIILCLWWQAAWSDGIRGEWGEWTRAGGEAGSSQRSQARRGLQVPY